MAASAIKPAEIKDATDLGFKAPAKRPVMRNAKWPKVVCVVLTTFVINSM